MVANRPVQVVNYHWLRAEVLYYQASMLKVSSNPQPPTVKQISDSYERYMAITILLTDVRPNILIDAFNFNLFENSSVVDSVLFWCVDL